MDQLISQQFDLWQQSVQTSFSCWQSMCLRSLLLTGKSPLEPEVAEEWFVMAAEKMTLTNDIAEKFSSGDSLFEPVQSYCELLQMINHKADANVNRLMNKW